MGSNSSFLSFFGSFLLVTVGLSPNNLTLSYLLLFLHLNFLFFRRICFHNLVLLFLLLFHFLWENAIVTPYNIVQFWVFCYISLKLNQEKVYKNFIVLHFPFQNFNIYFFGLWGTVYKIVTKYRLSVSLRPLFLWIRILLTFDRNSLNIML